MHFLKEAVAMIILGALPANTAAAPAPAPIPGTADTSSVDVSLEPLRDRLAIVNIHSGESCDGVATQFTVSGKKARVCHPGGGNSIQVSASHCYTSVWSGDNCDGPFGAKGIPDSSCRTIAFGSVLVICAH